MRKVSEIVKEIVGSSEVVSEAMRTGILNYSAYAELIKPTVEEIAWKSVQKSTIVVALARLHRQLEKVNPIVPMVKLESLYVQSPLADLTFEKNTRTAQAATKLAKEIGHSKQLVTITQGAQEITVIVPADMVQKVIDLFDETPIASFTPVVAITVTFMPEYLNEPNVLYAIMTRLAVKRINIIEVVSTGTALTIIIHPKDLEITVKQLETMFERSTTT